LSKSFRSGSAPPPRFKLDHIIKRLEVCVGRRDEPISAPGQYFPPYSLFLPINVLPLSPFSWDPTLALLKHPLQAFQNIGKLNKNNSRYETILLLHLSFKVSDPHGMFGSVLSHFSINPDWSFFVYMSSKTNPGI